MTIEQAIYERLSLMAPLTALVSTRIYQAKLPQNIRTFPAVRVQFVSEVTDQHLRGPVGMFTSRVQVDAYESEAGSYYASLGEVALAIRGDGLGPNATGLYGWTGFVVGSPALLRIHNIRNVHRGGPEYEGGELRLWKIRQDFLVDWTDMN